MATNFILENEDEIGYIPESEDETEEDEDHTPSTVNYGKIAKAIGKNDNLWSNNTSSRY